MNICGNCFNEYAGGLCPRCGYNSAADAGNFPKALKTGSVLAGRYVIGRVLGEGGFGITYKAMDYESKALVAIKEFMPEQYATRSGHSQVSVYSAQNTNDFESGKQNFLTEAKTVAQFKGVEGICDIYSYFEENGTAYFVMEYVEGQTLGAYLRKHGKLSVEAACDLLLPVMRVMDHVHSKGIIHRDIAPDNIMMRPNGKAVLIDFGAARYSMGEKSRSLDVVLKHGFAPLEQYARHGRQGPFTDVYAMAATFYYAVSGRIPPEATDRVVEDTLVLPSTLGVNMNGQMEDVLLKALEIKALDRYQRIGDFAIGLTRALYSTTSPYGNDWHEQRRKEEEERKRQQTEAERKHREEEERKRQQAEAERKRREEEERKRQQAEAERKRREEEERKRQQAEAERKRREEEARKRQQANGGAHTKDTGTDNKKKLIRWITLGIAAIFIIAPFLSSPSAEESETAVEKVEVKPTPTPAIATPVNYIETLSGKWGDELIYLRGTGESSAYFEPYSAVKNCTEMTMHISFNEYTGYPFDEWYLYARDLDGNWSHIAMFFMDDSLNKGETVSFTFEFDEPESFNALSIAHVADGYVFSVSYSISFSDLYLK